MLHNGTSVPFVQQKQGGVDANRFWKKVPVQTLARHCALAEKTKGTRNA